MKPALNTTAAPAVESSAVRAIRNLVTLFPTLRQESALFQRSASIWERGKIPNELLCSNRYGYSQVYQEKKRFADCGMTQLLCSLICLNVLAWESDWFQIQYQPLPKREISNCLSERSSAQSAERHSQRQTQRNFEVVLP